MDARVRDLIQIAVQRGADGVTFDAKSGRVFITLDAFEKVLVGADPVPAEPDVIDKDPTALIELIGRVCHSVNRAYCNALGDASQLPWEEAHEWQRESVLKGVRFHLENPDATPESSHTEWLIEKGRTGWVYGPTKDPEKKTHPCIMPYRELPREQRVKDYLFKAVVDSLR